VLRGAADRFREEEPAWRREKWVAPDLLHVTLAFLGSVPDDEVAALLDRLERAGERHGPFTLRLTGARAVPSEGRATMVWALLGGGVASASALRDEAVAVSRCEAGPRPYRPHVTLVRSRRPRPVRHRTEEAITSILADSGKTSDGLVSVPSFTLLASTLGAAGPTYRRLGIVPLTGVGEPRTTD
jgi:2'-5' RNA ligase